MAGVANKLAVPLASKLAVGIAQGLASFNPRNLFAANEPGYLYDLDDLSTVFLDSAMTTPATVNGLVGAVMDKSPNAKHATQGTTGSKPILRGTPTGANLVANGTFDTDTDWTKGTGWAIGSGVATKTAGTAAAISQPYSLVAGRVYRIEYTVSGATAGTCAGALFSGTQVTGPLVGTNGRRTEYLTALSGNNSFGVTSNATFNGSIDNLVIYDVSAGSVTAPYALQYDGVDDFLQTASVDFTATDKVTVCHGVRKLSDAAQGVVVEAADITTASGSFALAAPAGASNTLAFRSKGTILSTTQSNFTAPFTAVMCGLGDISGDTATLRVNGSQVSQNTADQGTGNYGNHILYFGRRSGTSNPYNGLMYSSVCIGRLLTAAELANVERWVARKTGVTL